jgi:bifunctional non-homologous end joining protein LigD
VAPKLDTYRRKRDPDRTPEPFDHARAGRDASSPVFRFVVQQHAARRLHWDLRLEIDGVLTSWAVPKGPSLDPRQKRLAVMTEDHPLAYSEFEGIIPAGNYGAGAMIVWDRGLYRMVDGVAPAEAVARGKLDLDFQGHKLRGRWALVRTKRSAKEWLLFKKPEAGPPPAQPELGVSQPASILSGLTVEELRDGADRGAELAAVAAAAGAPERALTAAELTPMLAETAREAFDGDDWIFELKHDGVRLVCARAGERVRLLSRNRRDLATAFPEIADALARTPCGDFVLDGEVVALDDRGVSSFERLQRRLHLGDAAAVARAAVEVPVVLYAFDLLAVGGRDVRALPLESRRQLLQRLVPRLGLIRFSDHIAVRGRDFFAAVSDRGGEGIVAKRLGSRYLSGKRTREWLKVKALATAALAIVGYQPGKGSRRDLGSLMLAWRRDGELVYAGNAGSGLGGETVEALRPLLKAARRDDPAFAGLPAEMKRGAVFVEPELVAEVRFAEVTEKGFLRQPVVLGLREDVSVAEVAVPPERRGEAALERGAPGPRAAPPREPAPAPALQLSNLGKVFWPDDGYTKGDLLGFYEAAWPALAPYLRDRPVVLTRYPDGIAGKNFFQRNAPDFTPEWATTYHIEDTDYFLCNDLRTLLYVINSACIPLHVWSARTTALDRPDWTILDFDPKGAPFAHVVRLARALHDLLEPLGVPHFVKTSGQAGLHVLLPLGGALTHAEARTLGEVLARLLASEHPEIATVARPLGERGGKVYVDFLQNGYGKTIAGPFSVRPWPGAPVSTPLAWSEVNARLDPSRFTIATVPRRIEKRPDPMRAVLEGGVDVAGLLEALRERG